MEDYNRDFIIETTPILKEKCKIFATIIAYFLSFSPIVIFLVIWFNYDFWIGIALGLFAYIVTGVVTSKLRLSSIPLDQIEISHSNLEIATWYVARHICFVPPNYQKRENKFTFIE